MDTMLPDCTRVVAGMGWFLQREGSGVVFLAAWFSDLVCMLTHSLSLYATTGHVMKFTCMKPSDRINGYMAM